MAERLHVQIEREGFETLGGYLLAHLGRVPTVGERFDLDGLQVEILEAERRRISKVRMAKVDAVRDAKDTKDAREAAEMRSRT